METKKIKRKIIVDGCNTCPFVNFKTMEYVDSFWQCSKFHFAMTYEQAHSDDVHPRCELPVNISTKDFMDE